METLGEVATLIVLWFAFLLWEFLKAVWFPLVMVGALCVLERLSGGFLLQNWAFALVILFSPLFPATRFHPLTTDLSRANWLVFILGLVGGLVLWFVHGSQMELRALKSPHLTPRPPV
ncbi:MAG: hypothetical protein NUW02_01165 [Candidatus Campbellbacteria bacterium]|nr:hypothetical protein [Candidatus Campbellbacteria bacterium]